MFVELPTQRLDRLLHSGATAFTRGLSPVSLSLAWADWAWHLALSPGRQMELAALANQLGLDSWQAAAHAPAPDEGAGLADDDPRFRDPAWTLWPFNGLRHAFRNREAFWREASQVPGMTAHHRAEIDFFARQWLGMLTPANGLATNPVVLQAAVQSGGATLAKGAMNWWSDLTGQHDLEAAKLVKRYVVGRDVAVTPGEVVWRNRLIELIRYAPQTAKVHPQPLLIVPSWIMKYYILDLSPHNSMVRYLVGTPKGRAMPVPAPRGGAEKLGAAQRFSVSQGHTVYMLSWRNPGQEDRDLSMDDYLSLGVFDALRAIGRFHGRSQAVHTMGYCLGGTLLAIAVAAIGRHGGCEEAKDLPPLASLSLLAAQTDFSEPGELGLFIDESQVGYLDEITRGQGYLTGSQMAGSFQFLHSRDLVWTRRMREYLMGEREQQTDLTAWNADTTRLPARMHHEYLTALYLHNALANSSYRVQGRPVSLADIRLPIFLVGTERDHISPWRSVYKLHHLCEAEITFVLASGGHNAGIISEPGHANRHYQIACAREQSPWVAPEAWPAQAERHEGSWWPAWQAWLAALSDTPVPVKALPPKTGLGAAPGRYVLQRYPD